MPTPRPMFSARTVASLVLNWADEAIQKEGFKALPHPETRTYTGYPDYHRPDGSTFDQIEFLQNVSRRFTPRQFAAIMVAAASEVYMDGHPEIIAEARAQVSEAQWIAGDTSIIGSRQFAPARPAL